MSSAAETTGSAARHRQSTGGTLEVARLPGLDMRPVTTMGEADEGGEDEDEAD